MGSVRPKWFKANAEDGNPNGKIQVQNKNIF